MAEPNLSRTVGEQVEALARVFAESDGVVLDLGNGIYYWRKAKAYLDAPIASPAPVRDTAALDLLRELSNLHLMAKDHEQLERGLTPLVTAARVLLAGQPAGRPERERELSEALRAMARRASEHRRYQHQAEITIGYYQQNLDYAPLEAVEAHRKRLSEAHFRRERRPDPNQILTVDAGQPAAPDQPATRMEWTLTRSGFDPNRERSHVPVYHRKGEARRDWGRDPKLCLWSRNVTTESWVAVASDTPKGA